MYDFCNFLQYSRPSLFAKKKKIENAESKNFPPQDSNLLLSKYLWFGKTQKTKKNGSTFDSIKQCELVNESYHILSSGKIR